MDSLKRLFGYTWPYRRRIVGVVCCAVAIGGLYAMGIASALPLMKVLISREGLHGWLERTTFERQTGVELAGESGKKRMEKPTDGHPLALEKRPFARVIRVRSEGGLADQVGPGVLILQWNGQALPAREIYRRFCGLGEGEKIHIKTSVGALTWSVPAKPWYLRWALDLANRMPRDAKFKMLIWLLVFILVINALRCVLAFLQTFLTDTIVIDALTDLRRDAYARAVRLPMTFFLREGTSDIVSRFMRGASQMQAGMVMVFGRAMREPLKALGGLSVALWLNPRLTVFILLAGPPAGLLIGWLGKKLRRYTRRQLEAWGRMLMLLGQSFRGIRVVKAHVGEFREQKRFESINQSLLRQQLRTSRVSHATAPLIEMLGMLAASGGMIYIANLVFQNRLTPTEFIVLAIALFAALDPVRKLSGIYNKLQIARAAADRIFAVMDNPVETSRSDAPPLPVLTDRICFDNIGFSYPGSPRPAVAELSLTIACGRRVGVVGPSGAGKSTLASLLMEFFEPDTGRITFDGVDTAETSLISLREQIGLVSQETILFADTAAGNIAYGAEDEIDMDAVVEAAKLAHAHEFIEQLPQGYDTPIAERGATLSGGQRQRLALARQIFRDPPILILDEALSQVDAESEDKIIQALKIFLRDRTGLIVAHRFSLLALCDEVAVMDDGKLIDFGPHEKLLDSCRLYQGLHYLQCNET